MILEAIQKGLPEPDISSPPPELIAQAREMMLEAGIELVENDDEE